MPNASVAAIITRGDGLPDEVLLARRNHEPYRDYWCLPGGHIDLDEPAHDAVVREVKEETGLDFTGRFFRYFDEIIPERRHHTVVLVFVGEGRGVPQAEEREVAEIGWFSLRAAATMELAFTHNEVLTAYTATLA